MNSSNLMDELAKEAILLDPRDLQGCGRMLSLLESLNHPKIESEKERLKGYLEAMIMNDLEGNASDVKGHLECRGLILGDKGTIHAIPELKGTLAGIDLSHEAAVGKIAEEEVEYLMARGLTRTEAAATIVRGFLRVDIEGLPPLLATELNRAIADSEKDVM